MRHICSIIARSLAGALGGFTLLNLAGEALRPGFDANLWWVDLRMLPAGAQAATLLALAVAMLGYALRPRMGGVRRAITAALVVAACGFALLNALVFLALVIRGRIDAGMPLPLSLLVAAVLAWIARDLLMAHAPAAATVHGPVRLRIRSLALAATVLGVAAVAFPLAQMFCFGKTDYSRPAGAIIVLGARAYADGRPSDALADRVRTACDLYHAGYAPLLIFSGGPGDGDVHETQAMRDYAISKGVPADAILLDPQGLNTEATVNQTTAMLEERGIRRALVVSHFYHLPRIKLTFQRQGREVYTVPARERYTLSALPAYVLREVAAIWWYYLQPLVG